jgi:hypothetical protein
MSNKFVNFDKLVRDKGFDIIDGRSSNHYPTWMAYSYDGKWSQSEEARKYFVAVIPVSRYLKSPEQLKETNK